MSGKAPEQSNDPTNKLQVVVHNPPETSSKKCYPPELGEILRSHIDGILKPLRKEIREIERAGEINKGKQVLEKSIDTAEKKVSFEFVGDQEWLQHFPDSDILLSKLVGWEIKGDKRKATNTCDMYYSHKTLGDKKLRSVIEVVNHILPEGYPKVHGKKRKIKVKEVSRKRKNSIFLGSSSSSQKTEEKSIVLREVSAQSSEIQIVIPSDDDERLEAMLKNYANNDDCIVSVGEKMDEDLDEIVKEFPEYDDLPNHFFN